MRGEISKLITSIGSRKISSEPCSMLDIEKPSLYKRKEVESALKLVLNPEELEHIEAKMSCTQASKYRGSLKGVLIEAIVSS